MTLDILDEDIERGALIESDHRLMRYLAKICGKKKFTFLPEREIAKSIRVRGQPVSLSKITKGISRLRKAGHVATRKTSGSNKIMLKTYVDGCTTYYLRGRKVTTQ